MQANKLTIKRAELKDAEVLTKLGITTFCETFMKDNRKEDMDKYIAEEMNLARITGELNERDNVFFLAVYDDWVIGYAKMRTVKKPVELRNNNPVELERIYVLSQYHDKKIGLALMDHCMQYAKARGHDIVWLGVWEHNHRAVNFYKRWGFDFFGSHIFRLGDDDQTDVLMKKLL